MRYRSRSTPPPITPEQHSKVPTNKTKGYTRVGQTISLSFVSSYCCKITFSDNVTDRNLEEFSFLVDLNTPSVCRAATPHYWAVPERRRQPLDAVQHSRNTTYYYKNTNKSTMVSGREECDWDERGSGEGGSGWAVGCGAELDQYHGTQPCTRRGRGVGERTPQTFCRK